MDQRVALNHLSQITDRKNGLEKARDVAVIAATVSGAALSLYYMDARRKSTLENALLGLGALALGGIAVTTFVNDVL